MSQMKSRAELSLVHLDDYLPQIVDRLAVSTSTVEREPVSRSAMATAAPSSARAGASCRWSSRQLCRQAAAGARPRDGGGADLCQAGAAGHRLAGRPVGRGQARHVSRSCASTRGRQRHAAHAPRPLRRREPCPLRRLRRHACACFARRRKTPTRCGPSPGRTACRHGRRSAPRPVARVYAIRRLDVEEAADGWTSTSSCMAATTGITPRDGIGGALRSRRSRATRSA